MNLKTGQRYVGPGGAEMIVSKASSAGDLTDGDIPLQIKGPDVDFGGAATAEDAPEVTMGKRLTSADGSVSVLITRAGKCDLRLKRRAYGIAGSQATAFVRLTAE